MTKEEWVRLLIHLPHGMIAGWIIFGCPIPFLLSIEPSVFLSVTGGLVFLGFIIRQAMQDWRKKDKSWKDVMGIVWGFAGMTALLTILWRLL